MKNRSGEKIKLASIDELLGVVNEESAMEINLILSYLWMRKDLIAIIALRIIRLMKTLSKRPLIMNHWK